jgi:hypothetical protein
MFKKGDKVICINDRGTYGIEKDKTYIVEFVFRCTGCDRLLVLLYNANTSLLKQCRCGHRNPNNSYYAYRLELVKPSYEKRILIKEI